MSLINSTAAIIEANAIGTPSPVVASTSIVSSAKPGVSKNGVKPKAAATESERDWTHLVFTRLSQRFDQGSASDVLHWAVQTFGVGLSIGTAFGASGVVLMDLALQIQPDVDIFYVDTGYFFPETEQLIDRLQNHYQRSFRRVSTVLTIAEQSKRYDNAFAYLYF